MMVHPFFLINRPIAHTVLEYLLFSPREDMAPWIF